MTRTKLNTHRPIYTRYFCEKGESNFPFTLKTLTQKINISDALRDLLPFVQFKKRERNSWRSFNFSKVAGFSELFRDVNKFRFSKYFKKMRTIHPKIKLTCCYKCYKKTCLKIRLYNIFFLSIKLIGR